MATRRSPVRHSRDGEIRLVFKFHCLGCGGSGCAGIGRAASRIPEDQTNLRRVSLGRSNDVCDTAAQSGLLCAECVTAGFQGRKRKGPGSIRPRLHGASNTLLLEPYQSICGRLAGRVKDGSLDRQPVRWLPGRVLCNRRRNRQAQERRDECVRNPNTPAGAGLR